MQYTAAIVKGKGRGMRIGFPTFNLAIPTDFNPKEGVYASTVWFGGVKYQGGLHFGPAPTFDDGTKSLEIFVINYTPGKNEPVPTELTFELGRWLRPVATFPSAERLAQEISHDVERIKRGSE